VIAVPWNNLSPTAPNTSSTSSTCLCAARCRDGNPALKRRVLVLYEYDGGLLQSKGGQCQRPAENHVFAIQQCAALAPHLAGAPPGVTSRDSINKIPLTKKIMADKGFNIQDIVGLNDVHVNMPTFLQEGNQFQP